MLFVILPGQLFLDLLWPCPDRPARAWRLGMTPSAGLAVTGILLLLAHYGGWYSFRALVAAAAVLNGALVVANRLAERRRSISRPCASDQPAPDRPVPGRPASPPLARRGPPDLVLAAAALAFLLALAYAASAPGQGDPPTEFYVLTPSGDLPFGLPVDRGSAVSQVALAVGIRNGEGRPAAFEVLARARGDHGLVALGVSPVHLLAGERAELPLILALPPGATAAVELTLYLTGDATNPHRSLIVPVVRE